MQDYQDPTTQNYIETSTQNLQPMNLSDILDGMFTLYRNHIRLYINIIVVFFVINYGIDKVLMLAIQDSPTAEGLGSVFLFAIVSMLLSFYIVAVLSYTTAHVFLGQNISPSNAFIHTLLHFVKFLACSFIYILVLAGLIITIIGIPFAVYMFIRWGFYTLPLLFEGKSVTKSLKRSSELVKGSWLRTFGITILIILIVQMIQTIFSTSIGMIFTLIPGANEIQDEGILENLRRMFAPSPIDIGWGIYLIRSFITLAIHSILLPIGSIGSTLLYFDLRIRKDAYDLEMQVNN
ncbi:hypothetical protein JT359_02980 [Candidatus Poribacteria bacterium]|nr:hypothetical protein [Candidatus Poribacteria bacterium]